MRRALPAVLALLWSAPSLPQAAAGSGEASAAAPRSADESALRDLEAKLAESRRAAAELAEKEVGLLGQLAGFERLIEVESRSVRIAQQRLKAGKKRLAAGEARLDVADGELTTRTKALGPRLLARYKMGREGFLRFLLGARSIGDVLRRRKLLAALVEHDIEALADLRTVATEARAARDELLAAKEALAEIAAGEAERRASLETKMQQQRRLIASVQDEKTAHDQSVRELEDAARALQARLSEIAGGKPPADGAANKPPDKPGPLVSPPLALGPSLPFKKLRGKLLFPVDGGRVEVRFGRRRDPRFGTITLQRGIDVRAPPGAKVFAVHAGRVVHSGWFRGYGNLVILDHGEGYYSLMAHLGTLSRATDDVVRTGDLVGTVGDTGSLKGPYLYFELREGNSKPVDPEKWLARPKKVGAKVAGKG